MNGFLNVLKPPGVSSAAIVGQLKRLLREKTGHAGTLDPEAAGVLPILLGRATRLLDYMARQDKEYIAFISFLGSTDTQDAQGKLTEKGRGVPDREAFSDTLSRFTGEIIQHPSVYSALKVNGVPMYRLARSGQCVQEKERKIRIDAIEMIDSCENGYLIRVRCSSGTYIRTLCHDIGAAMEKPAHMGFLLRTRSGSFGIEQAMTMEEIERDAAAGQLSILAPDEPLSHLPRFDVPDDLEKQARNGVSLPADDGLNSLYYRVYLAGAFLGVAEKTENRLRFRVIIHEHDGMI